MEDDRGIGVGVVAVPGQGGVADAEAVVEAERADTVADLVKTFDAKGRDE